MNRGFHGRWSDIGAKTHPGVCGVCRKRRNVSRLDGVVKGVETFRCCGPCAFLLLQIFFAVDESRGRCHPATIRTSWPRLLEASKN